MVFVISVGIFDSLLTLRPRLRDAPPQLVVSGVGDRASDARGEFSGWNIRFSPPSTSRLPCVVRQNCYWSMYTSF